MAVIIIYWSSTRDQIIAAEGQNCILYTLYYTFQKILKSGGKKRPSFLPDSAIESPVLPNGNASHVSKNVQLRALRPKGSIANMQQYNLPLKATPGRNIEILSVYS